MITTLIVEDNASFRKTLKEVLLLHYPTMRIEEAAEGLQALSIVHTHCPRLIFMDIRLPGENGLVLTRKIKKICPDTRIVILTSYDSPEYLLAAAEAGAASFAVKGELSIAIFLSLVRELKVLR